MKLATIEYKDVEPGMNQYLKVVRETPIGETPTSGGETPCNESVEYGVYPQIKFLRFAERFEILEHDMGTVPYELIEQGNYFGAEVDMYVSPELLDLLHAYKRDHVEHLKQQWTMEINNVTVAQGKLRRAKEQIETLKWGCISLAVVASVTVVALGYVVTRI